MSGIFDNNIFFKWINPGVSGSFGGGGKPVNYQKQNFFSADRVQKKFRRRSESQPRFFGGDDSRVTKTEISTCVLRQTNQKMNSYHRQNDEYMGDGNQTNRYQFSKFRKNSMKISISDKVSKNHGKITYNRSSTVPIMRLRPSGVFGWYAYLIHAC